MLDLAGGSGTPSPRRDLRAESAGMDDEVYFALRGEGWIPPGHVPVLLTREEVGRYLKPYLPPASEDQEHPELPAADARIADQAVWLLRTIDRFIAERPFQEKGQGGGAVGVAVDGEG